MISELLPQSAPPTTTEAPRAPLPFTRFATAPRPYYTTVAEFIGVQKSGLQGHADLCLFRLTRALGEKPVDGTVTAGTLRQRGYDVPSKDELLKSTWRRAA